MKLKPILITLGALVVLALVGLLVGRQILIGYLTPEFLTEQIESRWNCRAKIESVESSLLGTSKVTINGLTLFPKNETGAVKGAPPVVVGKVYLEVSTGDLIRRQLKILHLELSDVALRSSVSRNGESSLAKLFESIDDEKAKPAVTKPASAKPKTEDVVVVTTPDLSGKSKATDDEDFAADDLPLALVADRVEVKNGTVEVFLESSKATVVINNFDVAFTAIDVNPRLLDSHNSSEFQFGGDLKVIGADKADIVTAHIGGQGNLRPFNAATGQIDPAWAVNLTLAKGATLNTFPILDKMHEMLKKVDTAGIDLSKMELRGELMADATTEIHQAQGKYMVKQPLLIQLPDVGLAIKRDSWVDTGTNLHKIEGAVIFSEKTTQEVEKMVDTYLAKKMKGFRIPGLNPKDIVLGPVKKNGRIMLDVISEGDMSKPQADIKTPFGNLSKMIGSGKGAVDSLEKNLKSLRDSLFGK